MQHPDHLDLHNSKEDNFNLREFLEQYLFHWKWFALGIIVSVSVVYLSLRYVIPEYQVMSTILIQDKEKGGISSELSAFEDLGLSSNTKSMFDTEIGILNSRSLKEKVVKDLRINLTYYAKGSLRDSELYGNNLPFKLNFFGKDSLTYDKDTLLSIIPVSNTKFELFDAQQKIVGTFSFGGNISSKIADFTVIPTLNTPIEVGTRIEIRISKVKTIAEYYKAKIQIEPANRNSNLLNLTLRDENKEKATDILRVLVEQYNIESIKDKSLVAKNTDVFINERIEAISKELNLADMDVETFKSDNTLTDIDSESNLILSSNEELIKEIVDLETQLKLVDYIIAYINENENKLIPSNLGLEGASLNQSTNEYNEILLERQRLLRSSNGLNPIILNLDSQIDGLKTSITQSLTNLKSSLSISLSDLRDQEENLNSKIKSVPKQERKLKVIKRQQQIFEALYLYLLQKREENAISLAVKAPNAKVIDEAYGSQSPVYPKKSYFYLGSLAFGIVIPFVGIYLFYLFDNKVHSIEDIEAVIDTPILGDIPKSKENGDSITNIQNNRSPFMEALRIVRTNISFILLKNKKTCNTIFVSSTFKGEGKSFISIHISSILALNSKKVLLIGGDIRNPKLSEYLKIPDRKGLTHYLADTSYKIEDLIEKVPSLNFDLLQGGVIPPNPSELLINGRFNLLLDYAKSKYDYVIVDTPPVSQVTDTVLLSQNRADLFIYVVRANLLDKRMLKIPKKMHETKKIENMVMLLNDVNPNSVYGYGYGYGYDAETKKPWWKLF